MDSKHEYFMAEAITLAEIGVGRTAPNPPVGAVVVKNGKIIGRGFHSKAGEAHAEVEAIHAAGNKAKNATLYVTLEPCSTYGRTPPCTDFIIQSGIKRVYFGSKDPNKNNHNKSSQILKRAGIKVEQGQLRNICDELIQPFKTWATLKRPHVTVKVAQSLDGKIATAKGESKWITSSHSRHIVQQLRRQVDGVLVGKNTILKDNPRLHPRMKGKSGWTKVIVDSKAELSPRAKVFKTQGRTILFTTKQSKTTKRQMLSSKAQIIICPSKHSRVDMKHALRQLAKAGIVHLLVEGGGEIIDSLLKEDCVDEFYCFIAPKIIGGNQAPTSVGGQGIHLLKQAIPIKHMHSMDIGSDILIHGFIH